MNRFILSLLLALTAFSCTKREAPPPVTPASEAAPPPTLLPAAEASPTPTPSPTH